MTDERIEYILKVVQEAINTGASTRELAKTFKVSNVTIHSILTKHLLRLCEQTKNPEHIALYNKAQAVLNKNKVKTVDDPIVVMRVLNGAALLLHGKKIEEIAQIFDIDPSVIYHDLSVKINNIENLDKDICDQVAETMKKNRFANLPLGSNKPVENRDEKGRFV